MNRATSTTSSSSFSHLKTHSHTYVCILEKHREIREKAEAPISTDRERSSHKHRSPPTNINYTIAFVHNTI
ncbi:hypothetical protein Hanom_Chr04g00355861 [Helianthus anomalus]